MKQYLDFMKNDNNNGKNRALFATKIGAIASSAGAAVGLGNIWRFPYECGMHGGAAFIICYVFFIIILGIPVICSEFVLGRAARCNAFGAFGKFSKSKFWTIIPFMNIASSVMIISFYSVIAGWTTYYFIESLLGMVCGNYYMDASFGSFISSPLTPLVFTWFYLLINNYVLLRGVTKGIEKASNILMPILFLLIVIFCMNSLFMPEAKAGLEFMFKPDFSKITSKVILGALGQAFFSLSIGLGCLLTYASYFTPQTKLVKTAVSTAAIDTLVAIMAGVIIFPAVFTFGMEMEQGPTLVFEVFPAIFGKMMFGKVWSTLFFFLLLLASLTSTISMSEISTSYFAEEFKIKRKRATWLSTVIALLFGTFCCWSFGPIKDYTIMGMTFFDIFNYVSSDIFLPIGGVCISYFVGWILPRTTFVNEITNNGTLSHKIVNILLFAIRWIAPIGISLVLLNSVGVI